MKKLILILLLIPSLCFGNDAALIMGKAPSAISTILGKAKAGVASFAGAGVAALSKYCDSGTYAYCEDFESTVDCSDDTDEEVCRFTYTDTIGAGGSIDYNNSMTTSKCSSLATYDLKIVRGGANMVVSKAFTANATTYVSGFVKVNSAIPTLSDGSRHDIITLQYSTVGSLRLFIRRTGANYYWGYSHVNHAGSAVFDNSTVQPVADTWYRFRMLFVSDCDPTHPETCDATTATTAYIDDTQITSSDYSTSVYNPDTIYYNQNTDDISVEFDNIRIQNDTWPVCD